MQPDDQQQQLGTCPHCGSPSGMTHGNGMVYACGSDSLRPDAQTLGCEQAQKAVWRERDRAREIILELDGEWANSTERSRHEVRRVLSGLLRRVREEAEPEHGFVPCHRPHLRWPERVCVLPDGHDGGHRYELPGSEERLVPRCPKCGTTDMQYVSYGRYYCGEGCGEVWPKANTRSQSPESP